MKKTIEELRVEAWAQAKSARLALGAYLDACEVDTEESDDASSLYHDLNEFSHRFTSAPEPAATLALRRLRPSIQNCNMRAYWSEADPISCEAMKARLTRILYATNAMLSDLDSALATYSATEGSDA